MTPTDLRDQSAIVGVGNTAYTRGTDKSTLELHLEASLAALADAGLAPAAVDGVMPSYLAGRTAEEFALNLGLRDVAFSSTTQMGGASYLAAVQSACLAVSAGVANYVLLPAGRRGFSEQRVSTRQMVPMPVMATVEEFEMPYGSFVAAQWFAQEAQRHMYRYGTTSEQLGRVAVTIRGNANLNVQALMQSRTMTLDDHQSSRMITTPFRLFDCSLESDGGGAIVVTSAERARDLAKRPVFIRGMGEGHGRPPTSVTQKPDITFSEGLHDAGQRAFQMAGIDRADIDCAEIHDGFSWFILASLEALGFACQRGESGPFVEEGHIALGGTLPINTHGGALSEAHVSGVNHVIEAVRQLRGDVEPARQVEDCRTVLVANEGNFHDGSVLIVAR